MTIPDSSPPKATTSCKRFDLLVAASDETASSVVGVVSLDGGSKFYQGGEALGGDPALATSHGRTFWINRTLGTVVELDPTCGTNIGQPWLTSDSRSIGSSNPQDVAVAPDGSLWVARLDEPSILIVSADGQTQLCTIDLSMVTGSRKNPYMSSIRIIDDASGQAKAYVTLEMLSASGANLVPDGPSYVARIDVASQAIEYPLLELKGRNPFGLMVEYDGALYLAEPGDWYLTHESNAGIERVDLTDFTSELIVRESDVGASVAQVSVTSGCATAIVADGSQNNYTWLIAFDPSTGTILTPSGSRTLYTDAGYELEGMAWLDGGINVIGDGTGVDGKGYALHVLEASKTCTLSSSPTALFAPLMPIAIQPIETPND